MLRWENNDLIYRRLYTLCHRMHPVLQWRNFRNRQCKSHRPGKEPGGNLSDRIWTKMHLTHLLWINHSCHIRSCLGFRVKSFHHNSSLQNYTNKRYRQQLGQENVWLIFNYLRLVKKISDSIFQKVWPYFGKPIVVMRMNFNLPATVIAICYSGLPCLQILMKILQPKWDWNINALNSYHAIN